MIDLVKINDAEQMVNPPLGLLYIGDALKKSGYEVRLLHYSSEDINECANQIVRDKPLFAGFSVFTAGGIKSFANVCREVKTQSDIPIVWGGIHPTLLPNQCLNESYIDIIVFGEGEETVIDLASALEKRKKLSDVMGIGYKENGQVIITEPRPFMKNINKYRADWSLVDVNRYIIPYWDSQRVISFVTSRGCPHDCAFCYNEVFNRRRWRAHSIDFVVSEVEKLKSEHNIDGIRFLDDNFFVNKRRAFEITKRINLPYFAEARIDYIDEAFCKNLQETNCAEILLGIESGSDRILKLMNKDFSASNTLDAIKNLAKYRIIPSGSIILGYPTETKKEYLVTMKLVTQLLEIYRRISFTTGLYLPYPGTPSYQLAIKHGFNPPKRTEDWDALDRWSYGLDIPWVDHLTASQVHRVRKYIQSTSLLYLLKVPIFNKLAKYRLTTGNYFMDYDMRLWRWLRGSYAYGNPNKIHIRLIKKLRPFLKYIAR